MKTEIVPLSPAHVIDIIDRNTSEGKMPSFGVPIEDMIKAYFSPGSIAYCIMIDDVPVVCGGIINMDWHRGEAWMLHSSLFYKYLKTCYKAIKQMIPGLARAYHFRRIQAISFQDTPTLFKHLGFQREGVLRAFGPVGQDAIIFGRV